ncbi:MAG TPA: hypothetical protein VFW95_08905 [Candidatus Limnocylindria bacterium]|nr:hypothetical protein [Candidatus Limnocylindria bacterium]
MANRERLERLTHRWRARHEARRPAVDARPAASPEREALAARSFPYRSVSPSEYVAEHGPAMSGFTFDDEAYRDPALDAWILDVGRLLRAGRTAR